MNEPDEGFPSPEMQEAIRRLNGGYRDIWQLRLWGLDLHLARRPWGLRLLRIVDHWLGTAWIIDQHNRLSKRGDEPSPSE
jgi:hypothetical protein